jgi:uncharacterized protein
MLPSNSSRKLLALDSGGIRGMISIEVLAEIEKTLRKQFGKGDDFVLADYFDYIAGTSVGAIIATCLALGMSVEQVRAFFRKNAATMFQKAPWWERWHFKYRCDKLMTVMKSVFGDVCAAEGKSEWDATLGSDKLRTLLMVVMRNATTDSPWPVSSNPTAKYNCDPKDIDCNLRIPLWRIVRASTAAPSYFPPETIQLGSCTFVFDDGVMTPFGNPAFQLFLMATAEPYKLNWPTGEEAMLLVSVGTGNFSRVRPNLKNKGDHMLGHARSVPNVLIGGMSIYQDLLCRVFGCCKMGDPIDSEVGDLINYRDGPIGGKKLFTYLRYDADLSQKGLATLGLGDIPCGLIQNMDSYRHVAELQAVGRAIANRVQAEHFSGFPP